jgi:hypothetical protein
VADTAADPGEDWRAASASTSTGRSARPKCPYCDFNSHVRHQPSIRRASRRLAREIATGARAPGRTGDEHLPRRRHAVADGAGDRRRGPRRRRAHWTVAPDVEVTLEANPTSVEAERFRGYRAPASTASRSACRR